MLKAIFIDFYGTVAREIGPIAIEVIQDIYNNSSADSVGEVTTYWWKIFRERLERANGIHFKPQHEVALESFQELVRHFQCTCDPRKLLERMEEHWCTTSVYEDAKTFMESVNLPIYFVTNSDDRYILSEIERYHLKPTGIVTSEQAKYAKPRKEIFLYALEKAKVKPEEVIHIGDSLEGDVKCPMTVGIRSIWLNREKKQVPKGVESVQNLTDVLMYLK